MCESDRFEKSTDRYICLIDTEPNGDTLGQISAIICKEVMNDLEIIDKFNVYITHKNIESAKLDTINFFKKYPNCLLAGNNVHTDLIWICKFVYDLTNTSTLLSAIHNPDTYNNFIELIAKHNDTMHCKNILFKQEFSCWLNPTVCKQTDCMFTLDCKCKALRNFLFGNDFICVETSNNTSYKLYKSHLCRQLPSCELETLKSYFRIPNARLNALIQNIFKTPTNEEYGLHNAMYDTVIVYEVLLILKASLRGREYYNVYRSQLLDVHIDAVMQRANDYKYHAFVDIDIVTQGNHRVSILVMQPIYGKYYFRDALHIEDIRIYSKEEFYEKYINFLKQYPDMLMTGYSLTPKLAQLISYLSDMPFCEDMRALLRNKNLDNIKAWVYAKCPLDKHLELYSDSTNPLMFRNHLLKTVTNNGRILALNYNIDKLYYDANLTVLPDVHDTTHTLSCLTMSEINEKQLRVINTPYLYRGNTLNNSLITFYVFLTQKFKLTLDELPSRLGDYLVLD